MTERRAIVASTSGLHARPAHVFVRAAREAALPVTIRRPGEEPVSARSILDVMGLGAGKGAEVILRAEGPEADDVLDTLVRLIQTDLDEA